jgi:hypothetical protein
MVGAYVRAGKLNAAGGDHTAAFRGYEDRTREFVRRSRTIGPTTMKTLIPRTARRVWLTHALMRLLSRLPGPAQWLLSSFARGPARALDAITLTRDEPDR